MPESLNAHGPSLPPHPSAAAFKNVDALTLTRGRFAFLRHEPGVPMLLRVPVNTLLVMERLISGPFGARLSGAAAVIMQAVALINKGVERSTPDGFYGDTPPSHDGEIFGGILLLCAGVILGGPLAGELDEKVKSIISHLQKKLVDSPQSAEIRRSRETGQASLQTVQAGSTAHHLIAQGHSEEDVLAAMEAGQIDRLAEPSARDSEPSRQDPVDEGESGAVNGNHYTDRIRKAAFDALTFLKNELVPIVGWAGFVHALSLFRAERACHDIEGLDRSMIPECVSEHAGESTKEGMMMMTALLALGSVVKQFVGSIPPTKPATRRITVTNPAPEARNPHDD